MGQATFVKKVNKNSAIIIQTSRKGIYTGFIVDVDEDGMYIKGLNDEIIYLPYSNIKSL